MSKTYKKRRYSLLFKLFSPIVLMTIAFLQGSEIIVMLFLVTYFSLRSETLSFIQNLSTKALVLFLVIGVSFIFPLTNTQRGLLGLGFILVLTNVSQKWRISFNGATKNCSVFLGIEVLYYIIWKAPERVTQFLIYGYDNAFHFSLFTIYTTSEQFPNNLNANWPSDFEGFRNYSGGFYAIGSFMSSAITGDTEQSSQLIASYFLVVLALFVSIFLGSLCIIRSLSLGVGKASVYLWTFIAYVSSIGILLTNGYPPYLYAFLILLLLIMRLINTNDLGSRLFWSSVAMHLLLISQPLVSWNLFPWLLFLLIQFFRKLLSWKISLREISSIFFACCLAIVTYFLVKGTARSFGFSQLTAAGGIQPLTLEYWTINLITSLLLLYLTIYKERIYISGLLVLSASVPFIFLSGLYLLNTGSVGYYAIKQGYIWSYLVNFSTVLFYVIKKSQYQTLGKTHTPSLTILLMVLSVFVSLQGATTSRYYGGAFMGTFKNVTLASIGAESAWPKLGLDANQLLNAAKSGSKRQSDCFVYRRNQSFSDLGSRWLNALSNNFVTEACFAVYWNSDSLTSVEIKRRIINSGIDVEIISSRDPK